MVPRSYAELIAWTKSHEGKKLIRYTLGSVYTTIFSQAVIFIVYGGHIIKGVVSVTLFANLVTTIPSYHLNRRWAWRKTGVSHWRKEVVPYWTASLSGIAFSTLGAFAAKALIHSHHWTHVFDTLLVAGENLICFVIFWILKMLVFNKIFHTDKLRDIDEHLTQEERAQAGSTE